MHFNVLSHLDIYISPKHETNQSVNILSLCQASPAQPAPIKPGLGVQLVTAGTAACVADLFTFPLDTAKVRLQVQGELVTCCNVII